MSDDDETYCLYCQEEYHDPKKLRKHIEEEHPQSYAYYSVNVIHSDKIRID